MTQRQPHETHLEEVAAAFKDDDKNLVAPDCDTSAANAGHFIELSLRSLKAIKDLLDGETYDLSDMPAHKTWRRSKSSLRASQTPSTTQRESKSTRRPRPSSASPAQCHAR